MTSCGDCDNWSSYGCKHYTADTGEILHYYDCAVDKCKNFQMTLKEKLELMKTNIIHALYN